MREKIRILLTLVAVLLIAVSCESESYDTGDGALSYMRADFVEMRTDSRCDVVSVLTDDGEEMPAMPAFACNWASVPDTVYRALLYYNKVEKDNGMFYAEPLGVTKVHVPEIKTEDGRNESVVTDPLTLQSSWKGQNGRYLNLELALKTGVPDDKELKQTLGMMLTEVTTDGEGRRLVRLTLLHNQNGVPQYYTTTAYLSVPLYAMPCGLSQGDRVEISVNTYDGWIAKTFTY